jgi:hypothetical protein
MNTLKANPVARKTNSVYFNHYFGDVLIVRFEYV